MATIDRFFQYLVANKGSDLHLTEGQPPKVRVHGGVTPIPDEPVLEGETFKEILAEICEPEPFQQYLETGDLDFAYSMDEESRFRCNYLTQSPSHHQGVRSHALRARARNGSNGIR